MVFRRILLLGLLSAGGHLFAQEGELPSAEIDVVKNTKKIVLPEIAKPQEKVTITLKPLPKVKQKYSYREFGLSLPMLDPRVIAPQVRPERDPVVREGYVRGAVGNFGSTLLDAFYNSGRRKDYAYGLYYRHQASARGPLENSGFSTNELGAYGKYFTPSFILNGGLSYNRNRVNFYGYDRQIFEKWNADTVRQVLNRVDFFVDLENAKPRKKFHYRGKLNLSNIADRFTASESEAGLDFESRYRLRDSSYIQLRTDLSLIKRSDSADLNRTLWRIEPTYHFSYKGFGLYAGFQAAVVNEGVLQPDGSLKANGSGHFHPRLGLQQQIWKNRLTGFASFSGGMVNQSLRNQLVVNPFLAPDVYLRHMNQVWVFSAGVKGQWNSRLHYRTQISLDKVRNLAFYLNDDSLRQQFHLLYDSGSTNRFIWETDVLFDAGEKTKLGFRYALTRYTLGNLAEPWHLPNSILTLTARQYLSEKILLSGEFYYMGGLRGFNHQTAETEKLKPLADLNVKGEYFIKKRFSAFISVHNILNNRNQRFLHYPTQGFRLMVGGSATF